MRIIYNSVLVLQHTVGMLVISAIYFSKLVFLYDWHWQDDLHAGIWAVGIFVLHYALVFIGYKKDFITLPCLKIVQIIELVLIGLQVLLWIILNLQGWETVCPQILIYVVAILLRVYTLKKIQ